MRAPRENSNIPDQAFFIKRCLKSIAFTQSKDMAIPSLSSSPVQHPFWLRKKKLTAEQSPGLVVCCAATDDNNVTPCVFCFEVLERHDLDVTFWIICFNLPVHCDKCIEIGEP